MKDESPMAGYMEKEVLRDIVAKAKILYEERDKIDKPTSCECRITYSTTVTIMDGARVTVPIEAEIEVCNWHKGLEAETERMKKLIADAGKPWLALLLDHPIKVEDGGIDCAMAAACSDIRRLNLEVADWIRQLNLAHHVVESLTQELYHGRRLWDGYGTKRFTRAEEVCEWLEQDHTHGGSRVLQPQICDACKVLVAWMDSKNVPTKRS